MTHDYTRKGGIVHAEIMLPAHAPPEFADRSTLWNSVEQIEKARDSQLAREIEAALPRELSGEQQLALVRAYVKDNFVDKGMCADFAIHDKGTGNPHVHNVISCVRIASCCAGAFLYFETNCPEVRGGSPGCRSPPSPVSVTHPPNTETEVYL